MTDYSRETVTLKQKVEEVRAEFFDVDALREVPYALYRFDGGGGRWYYDPDADEYYRSVTTLIQETLPTPYGITEWIKQYGYLADSMRDERAAYGTFIHTQIAERLIAGSYDMDALDGRAYLAAREHGYPAKPQKWYTDAVNDMLSFEQFKRDHSVKPIAIEIGLKHPDGYAGALDIVCDMKVGSGANLNFLKKDAETGGRQIRAIIDFKSGRSGFYDEHAMQLQLYRRLWDHNFPESPVDALLNLRPKDWRDAPTYGLSDQTDHACKEQIPHIIELSKIRRGDVPSTVSAQGVLTDDTPLEDVYRHETMKDKIEARRNESEDNQG